MAKKSIFRQLSYSLQLPSMLVVFQVNGTNEQEVRLRFIGKKQAKKDLDTSGVKCEVVYLC